LPLAVFRRFRTLALRDPVADGFSVNEIVRAVAFADLSALATEAAKASSGFTPPSEASARVFRSGTAV
jgi:hypothetical protein